jgi:fructoselysine-6-P-deglycase FrlB-like protein
MTHAASGVSPSDATAALESALAALPDAVSEAITANFTTIREFAVLIAGARRVRLCGVGVSSHAAQIGEYLLRSIGVDARAANAFDLATYPAGLDPSDLVVVIALQESNAYSARVLQRAIYAGLKTVAVSGAAVLRGAEVHIDVEPAVPRHGLVSVVTGCAVLAAAAARCEPGSPLAAAVPSLPELTRILLDARDTARQAAVPAARLTARSQITGAGAGCAVAAAAAHTLRAATRLAIDGTHLEDALQGALAILDAGDLIVQVAPSGRADDRQADLAVVANALDLARWKIGGAPDGARWHTPFPPVPDVVGPMLALVPLACFVVECAIAVGDSTTSPRHDEAFGRISR